MPIPLGKIANLQAHSVCEFAKNAEVVSICCDGKKHFAVIVIVINFLQ